MILSILKIIGIILLIVLALLILILGILLFVPIRYQFDAKYEEKPDADVLVRWSPILLKVIVNYHEGKLVYIIRMLGGVVMTNQDIPLSWIGRKFFSSSDDEEYDDEGTWLRTWYNHRREKIEYINYWGWVKNGPWDGWPWNIMDDDINKLKSKITGLGYKLDYNEADIVHM